MKIIIALHQVAIATRWRVDKKENEGMEKEAYG